MANTTQTLEKITALVPDEDGKAIERIYVETPDGGVADVVKVPVLTPTEHGVEVEYVEDEVNVPVKVGGSVMAHAGLTPGGEQKS